MLLQHLASVFIATIMPSSHSMPQSLKALQKRRTSRRRDISTLGLQVVYTKECT